MPKIKPQKNTQASTESWENKWKCAVEMAAIAEIQRDDLEYKLTNTKQSLEVAIEDLNEARMERDIARGCFKIAYNERVQAEIEQREATKDAARIADILSGLELRSTEELARLERERDEARNQNAKLQKQIEGLNNFANERFDEIQRVRRERDEAREQNAKLRDIAERAINLVFSKTNAQRLRAELDQIKEVGK